MGHDVKVGGLRPATFERAAPDVHTNGGELVVAPTVENGIGRLDAAKLAALVNREARWRGTAGPLPSRDMSKISSAVTRIAPYGWRQDLECAGAIVGAIAALAGLIWFVTVITRTWDLGCAVALIMGAGNWNEKVEFLIGLGASFGTASGVAAACS